MSLVYATSPINPLNWLGLPLTKTLTFSNTSGTQTLFTVTGDVIVKTIIICTTDITSAAAANLELGVVGDTDAFIASTVATDLDAREIWHDTSPDSEVEAYSTAKEYIITDGNDIILTLSAQVDSGEIVAYCFWTPLSTTGSVTVA